MISVVFFVQYKSMGSSSHGIRSGGVVLDLEDLCDANYMSQLMKGSYSILYQLGRGSLKSIVSMSLTEFETIFYTYRKAYGQMDIPKHLGHLLGYNGGVSVFRKEITDKYGPQKEAISTTQNYSVGDIIEGVDGSLYVYMGNVKKLEISIDRELRATYSGHFYIPVGNITIEDGLHQLYSNWLKQASTNFKKAKKCFLKTKRKAKAGSVLKASTGGIGEGEHQVKMVLPRSYLYSYDRTLIAKSWV